MHLPEFQLPSKRRKKNIKAKSTTKWWWLRTILIDTCFKEKCCIIQLIASQSKRKPVKKPNANV